MKEFAKKIINSVLALIFVFGIIFAGYYGVKREQHLLSANVLTNVLPAEVNAVEFVSPKGDAYPVNGVVTINSVFVDTVAGSGNVSGADLENSFISFSNGVVPCPAGTVFNGNKIILPSPFVTACSIQIDVAGFPGKSTKDLTIQPVSCAAFQTSILRGQGAGFGDVANLGSFASTPNGFNFGNVNDPINSIDLNYPTTAVAGAKTFQIHLNFVPDVSVDPINGIDARAKIKANNGNGVYEINVRSEGVGNEVQTALNFAYVFNDLLGASAPFVASQKPTDPNKILLQTTEMGLHGNSYVCMVDGLQVASCFTGGLNGSGQGAGVLTVPLKLDNKILQGKSATVFAAKSAGEIQWISSHPSFLEVSSLSQAAQQDASTVDFVDQQLAVGETLDKANGAYSVSNCKKQFDANNVFLSSTCDTSVSIPVKYNISGANFTANVSIGGSIVPVTVQGSELDGFLVGTANYSSGGGAGYSLTGSVSGVVAGSISGEYSGTVTGQITATVQGSATLASMGASDLKPSDFTGASFTINAITEGVLTDVPTFTSTVKKQADDISHVAILYAKRPGTSILTAIDKQGCIASFDVETIEKKVVLQMIGRKLGDVLDVSNTVQINAFAGGADQQLNEYENITAASGIQWSSSNPDVASIDSTGLLTALKPGSTNITAHYDTGDTEIGTIESTPLQVTVNKISKLRVTFDKNTENKLPDLVVKNAHKSVIVAIHNAAAAGQTMVVEGQTVNITLPAGVYSNEISKVAAITAALKVSIETLHNSLAQQIVNVTTIDSRPGMLILQPLHQNADTDLDKIEDIDENGIIDIGTTALEKDVAILPTYEDAVPLPGSETYGLRVIAEYDNGATKLLPPTQFKWTNTPVNYLEQSLLDSGLIKLGQTSGTSTVVAEFKNADNSVVQSNYLTITVDSGPAIEFVRRIGSGSVTKGTRINLQTKITDVNNIADIKSIATSLVFSNFNTYAKINDDPGAIWFSATTFLDEVTVDSQSPAPVVTPPAAGDGTTPVVPAIPPAQVTQSSLKYKTYNIPVEIPVDQNLFDGLYKLVLTVSDTDNHTLNYVFPIRIGQIGAGDVNGDGVTNMIDVILAFQIAAGILPNPTPAQLLGANVDGIGGVTLVDVILLFNKVTNK